MQAKAKIGIWGFGIVGKSALHYFKERGYSITVLDQRTLPQQDQDFLQKQAIPLLSQANLSAFLEDHDFILPSPGIDLRPYKQYQHKWLSELDLFGRECHTPIIAITGSVGKTTTTHLLSQLLRAHGKRVFTGGNIGVGLLDNIHEANSADYVVLEISSFQLELCKTFAPTLALWTNFHPNHLDRHDTLDDYFNAKLTLFTHQKNNGIAIAPFSLKETIRKFYDRPFYWFTQKLPSQDQLATMHPEERVYFLADSQLVFWQQGHLKSCADLGTIPSISYIENIILIATAAHTLHQSLDNFSQVLEDNELPEHRLEKVATIHDVTFYNDSKSTIPAATLAALATFKNQEIILFLGGISKGINRFDFIAQLSKNVAFVYCFGKEAAQLQQWCEHFQIKASEHATLDAAFESYKNNMKQGQIALFSPSGASFDLFANYQERGNHFKKLVATLKN